MPLDAAVNQARRPGIQLHINVFYRCGKKQLGKRVRSEDARSSITFQAYV